jgi:hypothetical protein
MDQRFTSNTDILYNAISIIQMSFTMLTMTIHLQEPIIAETSFAIGRQKNLRAQHAVSQRDSKTGTELLRLHEDAPSSSIEWW